MTTVEYTYTNNSIGLRGSREYQYAKSTDYRLLFLGDSFTYGFGVEDHDTFASVAEDKLRAWGLNVEIINAGVQGTGTEYALNFFLKRGVNYHPDVVALFFFANDFADNGSHNYYMLTPEDTLKPIPLHNDFIQSKQWLHRVPFYQWVMSWSHVANVVKRAILQRQYPPDSSYNFLIPGDAEAHYTSILLEHMHDSAKQQGAKFVLFYIPMQREVEAFRSTGGRSHAESLVLSSGGGAYPAVSLTPILAGTAYALAELYFQEGHWTARANHVAAEHISIILRGMLSYHG